MTEFFSERADPDRVFLLSCNWRHHMGPISRAISPLVAEDSMCSDLRLYRQEIV